MRVFSIMLASFAIAASAANAQTVSTFDDLPLPGPGTYYTNYTSPGSDVGFNDGLAHFPCYYDTSYGDTLWNYFAYSNMTDSVTSGYGNQYSAKTAIGYGGSANYAVASCFNPATGANTIPLTLLGAAVGRPVAGFYVTNNTYAFNSMRSGDMFARKFHNGDWFKLTVYGYYGGSMVPDSVSVYLADFLFPDSTMNYILNTWQWVNLLPLGNVDSLLFSLSSTDNSMYGMNTPAYFCIDNFTADESSLGVQQPGKPVATAYPSPATDMLHVDIAGQGAQRLVIRDMTGVAVGAYPVNSAHADINVAQLAPGTYLLIVEGDNHSGSIRFVKQ